MFIDYHFNFFVEYSLRNRNFSVHGIDVTVYPSLWNMQDIAQTKIQLLKLSTLHTVL